MNSEHISRLANGCTRSFDEIYAHHHKRIYLFILHMSGEQSLAEDILQETFIRLVQKAPTLDENSNVGAWLHTVARNIYFSLRRRKLQSLETLREIALRIHGSKEERPDDITFGTYRRRELQKSLLKLSTKDREILILIGIEQMSHTETATLLRISEESLRQRLSRARKRFRNILDVQEESTKRSKILCPTS